MRVLEGVVTVVQEGRLLLTGDDGVTHLVVLSHAAATETDQLPGLQQTQARVSVRCDEAADMVAAYVARTLDVVAPSTRAARP